MTFPISVEDWQKNGSISRELEYLRKIFKGNKIYIFNYGSVDSQIKDKFVDFKFIKLCEYKSSNFLKFFSSIKFILLNKKLLNSIQIVRSNQLWGSWLCLLVKIIFKKKFILRCGYELYFNIVNEVNFLKSSIVYFISLILYKFSDNIVVTTKNLKLYISKKYFVPYNKITVIPNFINLKRFKNLKLKKNKNSFIVVGRLSNEKNYLYILNSFLNIKFDFRLTIVGSGPMENQIKHFIKQHNLKEKIILKSKIDNDSMAKIYNMHENFILSSSYEGNPKSLIEAMACELLVIGSNVRGINELIDDKENGILFNINNPNALRKVINAICACEIDKTELLKKNARKKIELNYSLEQILLKEKKLLV